MPALPGAEPIWAHAPALAHLQLALPVATSRYREEREDALAPFVRHIFSAESAWLDLRHPACPIYAVTISNWGKFHGIRDLTMSRIREDAGKAPEVAFEITSEWAGQVAADARKGWEGQGLGYESFVL
jgi:hypothetical protein